MAKKVVVKSSGGAEAENAHLCGILSYILVGIVWYFADEKMKGNGFVKFHVKQSLVLLLADIVVWIALWIIGMPLAFLGPLYFLWAAISWIVWICMLVLWILGIINAVNKSEKELPFIGKFASIFTF